MFARLCRGVASRAPRYALARAPARGMQGAASGRGKRKSAAPPTGAARARKTGGAGAKAAPAGLPSALAAPITTADPRMQEVGTEDKPKQKPFPKLPPDPPCAGQAVPRSWHAGRTPSEPAATLRKIGPDHRRGCAELPHRRRAAGTSAHPPSQRPARGWRGACSSWLGAALRVQASRLWDWWLSLPPPPLALITGVQVAARRARKGRAGASGAPAHACARSAAEAWGCGWLGSQRWRRRASAPNVANFT